MAKINPEITPEEIRVIRQELGLSQVKAGELLGGGPRAFTKYEAGTVKPAASVVNLLRLLEANPGAMATLKGGAPRPMNATERNGPFDVTGEHIAALDERTFPPLLRRLLNAEAHFYSVPAGGIHVASNVSAPDGGEDGRITWTGGPERTPFLPSRFCQFQLKAGKVTPAAAGREVLTKAGAVKDMVRSVLEAGGHYILLCAHPYVQKEIEKRETSIRKALRGAGVNIVDERVAFRDADQVAAWVNHHPAIAVWVKDLTRRGTIGPFRSWSHWAGRAEHEGSPWVEDERLPGLRAFVRERVMKPHGIARVVGLSGLGKSRLVLEALRPVEDGDFLHVTAMYADESEFGSEAINTVVQNLADMGTRAVVVVDGCVPQNHRVLVGMVSRSSSRLSLVTIDNEIPSGTLDETTIKIDEASSSVTEAIVNRVSPSLPSEDQRRLVGSSQGFPKIAISIGQAWKGSIPIAHATDDDLVDAFVRGRSTLEPELLLKSAKLLAAFGLLRPDDDSQLNEIAARGRNLTEDDLYAAVEDLVGRRVARRRGGLVVLQPRPIALKLAERQWRQWREWRPSSWDEVLAGDINPDLRVGAARQLALLDTTEIAKEVVDHVCRVGGPFDNFKGNSEAVHAKVLSVLAEVDSAVVVDQIERFLGRFGDLLEVKGDARRHIVWALEKIAFRPDTFEDGARLLLRLAAAENETWRNNATGQFTALFPVFLGNTAADGRERLAVLDEAAKTEDPVERRIVVEALIAGSRTGHFSRLIGPETHGSRPALDPWQPATHGDVADYIEECVMRLVRIAEGSDEYGDAVRTRLGPHLDSLVSHGFIDLVETLIATVGGAATEWKEALENLGLFLKDDAVDKDVAVRVRRLIAKLQPQGLKERVRFLVTEMPWNFPVGEKLDREGRVQRQEAAVRELVVDLVKQPGIFKGLLPQLACGRQEKAYTFGATVAAIADAPLDWQAPIVQAVLETPEGERNYDMLAGYITGIAKGHPEVVEVFKQEAACSAELAPALPLICWRLGTTLSDVRLVIEALREGLLSPDYLAPWTSRGAFAKVPASEVAPLFDMMVDHSAVAFTVAVDLMWTYGDFATNNLDGLRPQIRKLAEKVTWWQQLWGEVEADYRFEQIMKWMLSKGRQDPDACATALTLARVLVEAGSWEDARCIKSVTPMLLSDFPEIAWPIIGQAIVSDKMRAQSLYILGEAPSFDRQQNPVILNLPVDTLFAWCHAHPDHAPVFAARVLPMLTTYRKDAQEPTLNPVMTRLLDEFGDRDDVLRVIDANTRNFAGVESVVTYLALYKKPLTELRDHHPKGKVRRWAKKMLQQLTKKIEAICDEYEEVGARREFW